MLIINANPSQAFIRPGLLYAKKAIRAARQITSEFKDYSLDFLRTGITLFQEASRAVYLYAQDISFIGGWFLDRPSLADRAMNKLLGFENQKERLEYLINKTINSSAAKLIEILSREDFPNRNSTQDFPATNMHMLMKARLRIQQIKLDDIISRTIALGLKSKSIQFPHLDR